MGFLPAVDSFCSFSCTFTAGLWRTPTTYGSVSHLESDWWTLCVFPWGTLGSLEPSIFSGPSVPWSASLSQMGFLESRKYSCKSVRWFYVTLSHIVAPPRVTETFSLDAPCEPERTTSKARPCRNCGFLSKKRKLNVVVRFTDDVRRTSKRRYQA